MKSITQSARDLVDYAGRYGDEALGHAIRSLCESGELVPTARLARDVWEFGGSTRPDTEKAVEAALTGLGAIRVRNYNVTVFNKAFPKKTGNVIIQALNPAQAERFAVKSALSDGWGVLKTEEI